MKRFYIISLLLLTCGWMASAVTARLDSLLMYAGSEGSFTQSGAMKFYYNEKNNIVKEVIFGLDYSTLPTGEGEIDPNFDLSFGSTFTDTAIVIAYEYNDKNQVSIQYTIFDYDTSTDTVLREEYAYLEDGKIAGKAQYVYDPDYEQWMMLTSVEYTYEGDKLIKEETFMNIFPLPPMLFQKTDYTYNESGLLLSEITYDAAPIFGTLSNNSKTEYSYSEGKLKTEISYFTDGGTGWLPETHDTYNYDAQGNLVEILSKVWNTTTSAWEDSEKSVLTIDYNISNPTFFLPRVLTEDAMFGEQFTALVTMMETFVQLDIAQAKSAKVDVKTGYTELYWTIDGGTQTEQIEEKVSLLYPNPNQGNFTITTENNAKVTVINLAGQQIFQQQFPAGTHQISLQNPKSGLYMVQVSNGNTVEIQKFVVR